MMRGRGSLVLGLGLLAAAGGCTHQTAPPAVTGEGALVTNTQKSTLPPARADFKKDQQAPRTPKASTCVAYGDFRAAEAMAPDQAPEAREHNREQARKAYRRALEIDPKCL